MKLRDLTPMIRTWDIPATIAFYRDILGFHCDSYEEKWGWACLSRDGVAVMLSGPNEHLTEDGPAFTGSFYFRTDDVDGLWERLKETTRVCYPIEDFHYGMREFGIFDNNGYLLQFARPIEADPKPETSPVQPAGGADPAGSPTRDSPVSLREITAGTVRDICRLSVRADQTHFVATNAVSIAQAHFSEHAWFRAIYAGETPVGFLMLEDRPEVPSYYLWRLMIDGRYQRMDIGKRAMKLLIAHVRSRPGAVALETSVVQGPGSPQGFYENLGFALTGDVEDGEAVMRLKLV